MLNRLNILPNRLKSIYYADISRSGCIYVTEGAGFVFAVLQILEKEKDVFSIVREKFNPTKPVISSVAVRSGAPFFVVTVKKTKYGVPWQTVKTVCGRLSQRLLLPEGLTLPDGYGMDSFEPAVLPAKLILNCAAEAFSRCETEASRLSICIVDRKGVLPHIIDSLIMHAATIKIVTDKLSVYSMAAADIMERYGATLIIDDSIGLAQNCTAVITTDISQLSGSEKGLIFAPQCRHRADFKNVVTGEGIAMPEEYLRLIPEGVNPLLFASALHELCGVAVLEKAAFQKYLLNSAPASIFDISKLITHIAR